MAGGGGFVGNEQWQEWPYVDILHTYQSWKHLYACSCMQAELWFYATM